MNNANYLQLFIRFLKHFKIYEKYKRNFFNPSKRKKCINDIKISDYIFSAFTWSETNEGFYFWSHYHEIWHTIIKNDKLFLINNNDIIPYFNSF